MNRAPGNIAYALVGCVHPRIRIGSQWNRRPHIQRSDNCVDSGSTRFVPVGCYTSPYNITTSYMFGNIERIVSIRYCIKSVRNCFMIANSSTNTSVVNSLILGIANTRSFVFSHVATTHIVTTVRIRVLLEWRSGVMLCGE